MKTKHLLFLLLLLTGCDVFLSPSDSFNRLTPPIILAAESVEGDITVLDSQNAYLTIGGNYYLAQTISESYEKGDTILFHKRR